VLVLWHLLRIVAGYVLATVAAALLLAARPEPWLSVGGDGDLVPLIGELVPLIGETASHVAIGLVAVTVAGFPTVGFIFVFAVAIVASEAWSLRAVALWIVVGGLAGLGLSMPVGMTPGPADAAPDLVPMIAAGFAAGLLYWLIAGRKAGAWRRALPPPA
jgi:hypothetical protein